jgi:uncharacterized protein (TIGR01777 family)
VKILITGATGFVGKKLIQRLHEEKHELLILTRDPESATFNIPVHCDIKTWDPEKQPLSRTLMEGVDAVVNLAGENIAESRWDENQKEKIIQSRVASVSCLLNAMRAMDEKPKIFVSASAIGFYGDQGDAVLDENSVKGQGFLSSVCEQWEKEIFKAKDLGIRTVVCRIGMVLGHDGGALNKMLPPFQLGVGGKLGSGFHWMSWIHIDDLVNMMIHSLETLSMNGIYNAVSLNPVRNREFTKLLGKVLNRPTIFTVPKFILKFGLGQLSDLLLGSQRVSSKKIHDTGFSFKYPHLEEALREVCEHSHHEIKTEQWVPQSTNQIFDFFREARNLEIITPDFLKFRVVSQSTPYIKEGTKINYSLSLHGFPLRWKSKITDWKPGKMFSDIQLKGPYKYWHHKHEFEDKNGGTIIKDYVSYKVPLGLLGDLVANSFIRKDIEQIFSYRRKKINELFRNQTKKEQAS